MSSENILAGEEIKKNSINGRIKYPRTPHLPFSPGISSDDDVIETLEYIENSYIVVTEKMDGENITIYNDGFHSRSLDGRHHHSRDWLANFHSSYIMNNIPKNWRICGEYLYAKHSILYENLPSYFLGFSIWNDQNICLSWDETIEWFSLLNIHPVPVLYTGPFDEKIIKNISNSLDYEKCEGFVIRKYDQFHYNDFNKFVCKYVRKNHVQTDKSWKYKKITKNFLSSEVKK
jgi:hypothetical protein